jgi:protease IV
MKKSRTGITILILACLVAVFIIIAIALTLGTDTDKENGSWTDFLESGNKIGVIRIEGTIMSSDDILKQLKKYRKKSGIKAIVLRINSPGGTVAPAQEIYAEIMKTKKKKPVVASMETVAASAAYYISSSTDRVVASPGTITGSIGVIMMLPDIHNIIDKIGVSVNIIKAGKFKDIGSGVKPLSPEERDILESFATEIHEQFISDVAEGRKGKIEKDKLKEIADGRFFSGEKAKAMGLVDDMGNFYDAVKIAADLAKIKGEPELVYPKKKWDGYMDLLTESMANVVTKTSDRLKAASPAPVMR